MDETATIYFPAEIRGLLDAAVLKLWDPARPVSDLSPVADWLEADGWDHLVRGTVGSYRYVSEVAEYLDDFYLIEYTDIEDYSQIKNADRLKYARMMIADKLEECMDSIHCIPVESLSMPPAALCMVMYYHPQGGAEFGYLEVCHSIEDYLESFKGDIIMDVNSLSDREILRLWRKAKSARPKKKKS